MSDRSTEVRWHPSVRPRRPAGAAQALAARLRPGPPEARPADRDQVQRDRGDATTAADARACGKPRMSDRTRMVSKHRWRLDDLGDPERMRRLLNPPACLELLNALMAEAVWAAQDCQIVLDPHWDWCISRPEFGTRVHATMPVTQALFDPLFNGRSGYRAQYCLSIKEGRRYNRAIVDAVVPALRHAYASLGETELQWAEAERSLTGRYSKIWVADDEEHFQNAPAALHVPGWTGNGQRVPLPSSPRVDVKGTYIQPGSHREETTKRYRDRCLHQDGWPG